MQAIATRRGSFLGSSMRRWLSGKPPRTLITGGLGQLGTELAQSLRMKYGNDNVILSDNKEAESGTLRGSGPFIRCDVTDFDYLDGVVKNEGIDWLVHFATLLSAIGEKKVDEAIRVNIGGFHNILDLTRKYNLRLFCPSTIGAFGPSTPRIDTPDVTIQRPNTIYGVSKVHVELLGEYYHQHPEYQVDFRCARFPGILSGNTLPGGGTTDYAVHIFYEAIKRGRYTCYLRPDTRLPMMYIDDCIRGTVEMLHAPSDQLKMRTYNMAAFSFTPDQLVKELQKYVPHLKVDYVIDPVRQKIADSWPESLNDSNATKDWGWKPDYDLAKTTRTMYDIIMRNIDKDK